MRGTFLEGSLNDGDVVEVQARNMKGHLIQTEYAYNRTMNSELRMRRGISGAFAKTEAQWGGKGGLTRLQIVLGGLLLGGRSPLLALLGSFG